VGAWYYFDANALAKRYSQETGTELINELFHRAPVARMACLSLSILEIMSILVRKKNDGRLSMHAFGKAAANFRAEVIDAKEFSKATINDAVVLSAMGFVSKHSINATDAVILRSVLNMKEKLETTGDEQLILITSDKRLAKAAKREGVTVFDPEVDTLASLQESLDAASKIKNRFIPT